MRIPTLGKCLETMSLARMAWTLSATVDAGMDARQSVRVGLRSTQNVLFTEQARFVDRQIASGHELHEAFRAAHVFPQEFIDALEVGEQTGKLDESMQRLSEQYHQQAEVASKALTTVASFAVWGIVALTIIVLIFRVAMFIIGTYQDALRGI